jgi:hypothetical protein
MDVSDSGYESAWFLRTTKHIFWFHISEELFEQVSDFSRRAPLHTVNWLLI